MKRNALLIFGLVFLLLVAVTPIIAQTRIITVGPSAGECGETTFTATNTTTVGNAYLVVEANGVVQYQNIPNDGSSIQITVGPFFENTTIYWRVFGGGERDYDQPLWNGYGEAGFGADVNAYAASVGSWSWVVAGTDDPNPFVNWYSIPVEGCPLTKDQCKNDGWMTLGFANQGLCIKNVNEQQDSE